MRKEKYSSMVVYNHGKMFCVNSRYQCIPMDALMRLIEDSRNKKSGLLVMITKLFY
jgi:hypothetical protein